MNSRVPIFTPDCDDHIGILSGEVVTSEQWKNYCHMGNWLAGHGTPLVVGTTELNSNDTKITAGTDKTYRFFIWPNGFATSRLWIIRMSACLWEGGVQKISAGYGNIIINEGGPDEATAAWATDGLSGATVYMLQNITTPSATPVEVTVKISNAGNSVGPEAAIVEQISCTEMPRYSLDNIATKCDIESNYPAAPIYKDGAAYKSVYGPHTLIDGGFYVARRAALFNWYRQAPFATNSETPVDIFADYPIVLGRYLFNGDTERVVRWCVYGVATSTTSGHRGYVRATSSAGHYTEIMIPAAPGWTAAGTLIISAEDMTTVDGRRNSTEEVQFTAYVEDAAESVSICGISMGEYTD